MSMLVVLAWFLLFLGLALAFLELILPTGGILLAAGGTAMAAGIAVGFFDTPSTGWTLVVTSSLLSPLAWFAFFWLWPHTPLGRRFFLSPPGPDATFNSLPAIQALSKLVGSTGVTTSHLRPSGTAEFDGKRIDCISEGMMLPPGTPVRCVRVSGGSVFVRQTDSVPGPLEAPSIPRDLEFNLDGD
jgi:membrane-bound serine protease (ClpP class)